MSSLSTPTVPTPPLFVPRKTDPSTQGRGLIVFARLQHVMLAAWLAFVTMLPENLYGLLALVILLPLWGLAVVMGLWHLAKVPNKRPIAVWVMVAFPVTLFVAGVLSSLVGLPIVESDHGEWVFIGVLLAYPVYWLGCWLLRVTKPIPRARPEQATQAEVVVKPPVFKTEPNPDVRRNLTDTVFLAVFGMLMLQSLLLVGILPFGDYFSSFKRLFGGEWYTNLLFITLGTTTVLSVAAVPYAILRLIRGTPHKAAMITILVFIVITVICSFGLLAFFSMLMIG